MYDFTDIYLDTYCDIAKVRHADVLAWLPVLAVAGLEEGIKEDEEEVVQMVESAFATGSGTRWRARCVS